MSLVVGDEAVRHHRDQQCFPSQAPPRILSQRYPPSWEGDLTDVLAVVDSLDAEEARDAAVDYLLRGLVPDYLMVPPIFTRDDIAGIFQTFLDSLLGTDWDELAEIVGSTEPPQSDDEKTRILNLYLDRALTIHTRED